MHSRIYKLSPYTCSIAKTFTFTPTGAEKLVRHLHKHGIPLALATGSGSAEFELKIDKHRDLFNLFLVRKCNLTIHLNSSQYIFNLDKSLFQATDF